MWIAAATSEKIPGDKKVFAVWGLGWKTASFHGKFPLSIPNPHTAGTSRPYNISNTGTEMSELEP